MAHTRLVYIHLVEIDFWPFYERFLHVLAFTKKYYIFFLSTLGIMLTWRRSDVLNIHLHRPHIMAPSTRMLASYGDGLRSKLRYCNSTWQSMLIIYIHSRQYSLFETTQTLFWAAFGLIDLDSFELDGIKIFTRFWGMLMFGCYSVINIVVLLNLLIAMMNHSYQLISVSLINFFFFCDWLCFSVC